MYRRLRNHVTARLRMAKLLYFESLSEESRRNPRKLWNGLNKALGRKNKHKIDSLTTPQGILRDEQDIANEFSDFFSKWVSTSSDTDDDAELENLPEKLIKNVGEFSFHKVDEEVVLVLLHSLDPAKATGLDGFSARMLKMAAPGISDSVTSLFNVCLESGQMPDEWKLAKVTPVPKVSSPDSTDKYRPISVLPVIAN